MKRSIAIFIVVFTFFIGAQAQGCMAFLNDGVQKMKNAKSDLQTLTELELYFSNVDAACKDEIGNSAAMYATQIRELKASLIERRRRTELQKKEVARKIAEEEQKELERMRRDSIARVKNNLVYVDGYGRLKDGTEIKIVQLIKGYLTKYNIEYAERPEEAVWAVYIAVDERKLKYLPTRNKYFASAEPIVIVRNLITGKELYEGSALEYEPEPTKNKGDALEATHIDEMGAIRPAFRKTIPRISMTIVNFIKNE